MERLFDFLELNVLYDVENLKFLHPVGVSTFKYGVTIPLEAQTDRLRAIEKGGKVAVSILCGAPVRAWSERRDRLETTCKAASYACNCNKQNGKRLPD